MPGVSLLDLDPGDSGRVVNINAGWNGTKRLYEMGLNTGARFRVVKNDTGPVIIALSGNKLAIGRGLAQKISVSR